MERKKSFLITGILIITLILATVAGLLGYQSINYSRLTPAERVRLNYEEVTESNMETSNDSFTFGAYFLSDIDGDGVLDKVNGSCNKIGEEDALYIYGKVADGCVLSEGVITIESENIYFSTNLIENDYIEGVYINENTTEIMLKEITGEIEFEIKGTIRSGDYSSNATIRDALYYNYSRYTAKNAINFNGVITNDEGTEDVRGGANVTVDWYGESEAQIKNREQAYSNENIINEAKGTVELDFNIEVEEIHKELFIKKHIVTGIIPKLNGYDPLEVVINGETLSYTYDETTRSFYIERGEVFDDEGYSIGYVADINKYQLHVEYPIEAYNYEEEPILNLEVPIETYFESYNNPDSDFENPLKSNVAADVIHIMYGDVENDLENIEIKTTIGENLIAPYANYVISKNQYSEIKDIEYSKSWQINTSKDGETKAVIISENVDSFVDNTSVTHSIDETSIYTGLYFINASQIVKSSIKVYNDDTNELIHEFTESDWSKYSEDNLFEITGNVYKIRIELDGLNAANKLYMNFTKRILGDKLADSFDEATYNTLNKVKSYMNVNITNSDDTVENITAECFANFDSIKSIATISNISKKDFSVQNRLNNVNITISTIEQRYNTSKWMDGEFLMEFPAEIYDVEINGITVNNEAITIKSYEKYSENGKVFLKINTQNVLASIYDLNIDCDIVVNADVTTGEKELKLYYDNGIEKSYLDNYSINDELDMNDNNIADEKVGYYAQNINIVKPDTLNTYERVSNYNSNNDIEVSPRTAVLDNETGRTAQISINISNENSNSLKDIIIVGKIPFKGNKSHISAKALGSTYSTKLTGAIEIPAELQDYTTVYYSEKENVTNSLENTSNNWIEDVTDYSKVKTFLIKIDNYEMLTGNNFDFNYTISIPDDLVYNDVAYATHAVFYSIVQADGTTVNKQIESSKLGLALEKQFTFNVNSVKKGYDTKVEGIVYSITEENTRNGISAVTDENGDISVDELVLNKTYIMTVAKDTDTYSSVGLEIKFKAYEENDELKLEILSGGERVKSSLISGDVIDLVVELESKTKLIINVTDDYGSMSGAEFRLVGENLDQTTVTGTSGIATISGLELGVQYTFKQTDGIGHAYDNSAYSIKINRNDNGLYLEENGGFEFYLTETAENENELTINISNTRIEVFNLRVNKTDSITGEVITENVYNLSGDWLAEGGEKLEVNNNGYFTVSNLYQGIEYQLTEYTVDDNYAIDKEPIIFTAYKDSLGRLVVNSDNENYTINDTTVTFNLVNNKKIKIYTKELEEGSLVPNAKYSIKALTLESNKITETEAYDVYGDLIGRLETINGENVRTLTSDENGSIKEAFATGLYKLVNISLPAGYVLPENADDRTVYFGVGMSIEDITRLIRESKSNIDTNNGLQYVKTISNADGSKILVAEFETDITISADKTTSGEEISISLYPNYTKNIAVLKLDADDKVEWVSTIIGKTGDQEFIDICNTTDGYLLIGNTASESVTAGNVTITNNQTQNAFVTKIGTDGTISSGYLLESSITSEVNKLAKIDEDIYIVGNFTGEMTIVSALTADGNSITLASENDKAGLIVKINSENKIVFAKTINSSGTDNITGIEVSNGNLLVNIETDSTELTIPSNMMVSATETTYTVVNSNVKLEINTDGKVVNERTENNIQNITTLAMDDGYLLIGEISSTYVILAENTVAGQEISLTPNGETDIIYAKYDSNGKIEWAKILGGNYAELAYTVKEDTDGNYIILGNSNSTTITVSKENVLNGYEMNTTTQGYKSALLMKITPEGKTVWLSTITDLSNIYIYDIAINGNGVYELIGTSAEQEARFIYKEDTSLNAISRVEEFDVTVDKQIYTITAKEATGGKIVDQDGNTFTVEELTYGQDSSYELSIIPDTGYELLKLTINGQNVDFTVEDDGSIKLPKYTNVTESIYIEVEFATDIGNIIIHHYKTGTEESVSADETIRGNIGESYNAYPLTELEDYVVDQDNLPTNTTGVYTSDDIIITFYYVEREKTVTVHHYLEGSDAWLADDEILYYSKGEEYQTSEAEVDEQYELAFVVGETSGTVDESIEVFYYYRVKDFDITTEVLTGEGNITGSEYTVYETVKYGETSTKDITIKAEDGYAIQRVVVNYIDGENIVSEDITAELDLTQTEITLDKFENVTQDINVQVDFDRKEISLTVHYYEENTTIKVSEDKVITGFIGDEYETSASEDVNLDKYELIETPVKAIGIFEVDGEELIYYYRVREYTVTGQVNGEGGTVKLGENTSETVKYGNNTTNTVIVKPNYGYSITEIKINGEEQAFVADGSGNVDLGKIVNVTEDIIIEATFERVTAQVIVNYYETGTTTSISNSKTISGYIAEEYVVDMPTDINTDKYIVDNITIDPEGSTFDPETLKGTFVEKLATINVYFKIAEFTISSNISDGGTITDVTETVKYGETSTKDIIITPNYEYKVSKITVNGEEIEFVAADDKTVTIDKFTNVTENKVIGAEFEKLGAKVTVKYVDTEGNELKDSLTIDGKVGESYTTERADIENYRAYGEDPGNKTGTFIETEIIVTYVYEKIPAEVLVEYVDKDGNSLGSETLNGFVGEAYITERKTYEGYRAYGDEPANKEGTYTESRIVVTYVYEKIPAQVIVNYYEYGTGDKIADEVIIEGNVTESYTTQEPENLNKDKYLFREVVAASDGEFIYDTNTFTGTYIEDITYVNYYYEVSTFTVSAVAGNGGTVNDITETVRYGETSTKDLIITPDDGYKVSSVKIDGQEIEYTENADRTATINKIANIIKDTVVNVEFERILVQVKVNYYETNSAIAVAESRVIEGYVNDSFVTEELTDLNPEKYTFSYIDVQSTGEVEYDTNTQSGVFKDSTVEITYYYDVTTFGISGIAGTGGEITDITENVKYGENSTKDIIINPDYGYKVTNIFINGTAIEFTEAEDGTVTLEKFTDVRENKLVLAQFARRATYTYINYYEENTTNKIADTYMQTGFVDEEYTAKEPDGLDYNKYTLTGITVENDDAIFDKVTLKGRFVESDTIINYFYKVTKYTIRVMCGSGGSVNTDTETVIYGEDSYKDLIIKPNIGYRISKITVNGEEIEFTPNEAGRVVLDKFEDVKEDKNIVVEFEPVEALVVINYVDTEGNIIAEQEARGGYVGETYNIQRKDIPKYQGVTGDQDSYVGIFTEKTITITFVYEKVKGRVKVEYVDPQGNFIISSDIIQDVVDTPYETERKEIYGYRPYGEDPENKSGIITEGMTYVRYVYEKIPAQITVNYVKDTGEQLAEPEVINGYVGETYTIIRKGFVNYTGVVNDPNEYTGEFTEEPKEITFVYEKIKCKVTVRYVDTNGVEISPSILLTGEVAESYETTRKDIENYRPTEPEPTNTIGVFTEEEIIVTYVYEKIPAQIVVKYVDTEGNNVADPVTINGYLGDNYKVERKEIYGYRASGEEPANRTGKYTVDPIEIVFVYERIPAQVIVKYVDTEGKELLPTEIIDGYVGDTYTTSRKNIEFYKKSGDNPSNAFGEFTEDVITVTYVYEKIQGQVVVKHLDVEGNVLVDDEIIEGEAGDEYTTERKTIYGYKAYGEDPENKAGIITEESIEVIYVYERVEAQVIVKHLDTEGNAIAEEEIINGYVTDKYETQRKEIEGYEAEGEDPENKSGEFKEEVIEVVYVYKIKQLKIVTQVVGPEGCGTVTGSGEENYEIVEYGKDATKDIIIAIKYGYRLIKVTVNDVEVEYVTNEDGTFTIPAFKEVKEDKIVKVEIEKIKADVVVKYVDTEGNNLAEPETIEGLLGDKYKTERKEIPYYRAYGEEPENAEGTFVEGVIEVTYVYERIPSGVITVKYLEKDTNKELAEEETISGFVGEMYEAKEKKIDYYKLVSVEEKDGKLSEEDKVIIFYYEKLKFDLEMISYVDKVTVNGVDRTIGRDNIAKVEIERENTQYNEVLVTYKVVVKNSGEMAGYATTIIDYMPSGMIYLEGDNLKTQWIKKGDMLVNTDLEKLLLQPGEYAELELVLRWDAGDNSYGERVNQVLISDYINEADWKDINTSNNTSKVSFIITVKTGHINQIEIMSKIFDIVTFIVLSAGIIMRIIQIRRVRKEY